MTFRLHRCFIPCLGLSASVLAADVYKANNSTGLNAGGSWTGGVVPGVADVAVWDAPYSVNPSLSATLGASATWSGIRVVSPVTTARVRNTAGAVLTLGAGGIDMGSGSGNFEMYAALKAGASQTWNVPAGRTLTLQGDLQGTGVTITKSGAGVLSLMSTALNYPGALTLNGGTLQVSAASGTVELSGSIGGSAPLAKSGLGTLTLSGDNTGFSGGVTLSAGQINLNHAAALGSGVLVISGGAIDNAKGAPVVLNGAAPIAWNANFTYAGSSSSSLDLGPTAVSVSGSRTVTVSAGSLILGNGCNLTGDATAALAKLGAGVMEARAGSSVDLQGKITVGGGTLRLSGGSVACGSVSGNLELSGGAVELNGGTLMVRSVVRTGAGSSFRLNGGTLKPRADSSTFLSGLENVTVGAAGAVFNIDGWYVTIAQPLLHDPALGGTRDGGLQINDEFSGGVLTINGACTYTGPTVIRAGTLAFGSSGSILASPVIEVATGAALDAGSSRTIAPGQTLKGTGTVLGNLTIGSGGVLAPAGESIGSLGMVNTLTIAGEAVMQIHKTGSTLTCDQVEGLTQLNYGGTLTVTATGGALAAGDSFKLFSSAYYGGGFATLNLPPLPAGLFWETAGLLADGRVQVVNTLPSPVLNPPAGAYLGAQTVSISGVTGATIQYTMDGTDPRTSPTAVTGETPLTGIVIPDGSAEFTIKTCQSKAGAPASPVTTALYRILNTGTWIQDGSGTWSDVSKWQYGLVPQGSGITADFSTLALSSGATITLDAARTIGRLRFGDLNAFSGWTLAGSSLTLANGTSKPAIHVASGVTTITSALAGSDGYAKTGAGNLVSQLGNPGLSGNVVVGEGYLMVDRMFSAGSGTIVIGDGSPGAAEAGILQRGTDPWPPAADFGTTNNILVAAGSTGRLVIGRQSAGNYAATFTGTITLNNHVVFRNNGGDRLSIDGKITGTGNVTVEGGRTNWSSPANDFVGDVTVAAGAVLQTNAPTTIPAAAGVTVYGLLGTNQATGETLAIGSLNGTGTIYRLAAGNPTLSIGGNGRNGVFEGAIQNDFPVVKTGAGTQVLAGASTYTGGTAVNGGILFVNNSTGSGTGSGAVVVNNTATLGGTGAISGAVTVNSSATLAPGHHGVGTLATGALNLAGSYQCQLNGTASDLLAVSGNLNLTGSSLAVAAIGSPVPGTYVIATYTGTLTGAFSNVTAGCTVDYATPNQIKLTVAGSGDAYETWLAGFGLSGASASPAADPDRDGIANSLEFVLGGNPAAVQDQGLLPSVALVTNPGGTIPNGNYLRFTYRRTPASAYLAPQMQFDADLSGVWTDASGAPGVVQVVTPNAYTVPVAADKVEVYVPRVGHSVNGKLFGRLRVVTP